MKQYLHSLILNLSLLILVGGCDSVFMDKEAPPQELPDEETDDLYTLPDQPVAIDLRSLPGVTASATFRIERPPQTGEARFTNTGLLLYTPGQDFVAGEDVFALGIEQGARTLRPFRINVAADSSRMPCHAGPIPDFARTPVGKAVVIDVLKNDRFCNVIVDRGSLAVQEAPENGTVREENGKMVYTPNSGFSGVDTFIYRIIVTDNEPRTFLGTVRILVGESPRQECKMTLRDDNVVWKPRMTTDSLAIPVLANDQLCRDRSAAITLTKAPSGGSATVTRTNLIVYRPNPNFTGTDELRYRRCEGTECAEATVRLRLKAPEAGCILNARDDSRTVGRARQGEDVRQGFVYLPILNNDRICQPIASLRITENLSSANLEITRDGAVVYRFPSNLIGIVTFKYELIDMAGNRSAATVKIEFK